jgi:lipopolysaccharide transport system ATP-binding protein
MFSDDIVIRVSNLSKNFHIYDQPFDRLKQSIMPRLQRLAGRQPKKYFRDFWALRDISFEVKKGETVGVIGCNGSGKSTLLQLICGTLTPTIGNIENSGRIAALLELGSGFNPEFTGRENVYLNGAILGLSQLEIKDRFDDIVSFADIGDFLDQPVKTYSSGMSMRLAFAVAINIDPQILVVDEALSVGDEMFQRKCFAQIEKLKKNGATILFVSHSAPTIIQLSDRTLLIDAGEMLAIGLPKTIVAKYQRLMYSPPDKREMIRHEIRTGTFEFQTGSAANNPIPDIGGSNVPSDTNRDEIRHYYDVNLKPQSTVEYESFGALIESPEILALSGEKVNCLKRGGSYIYAYIVRFQKGASNVRFTMMIKTTAGFNLGGAISAGDISHAIAYVAPGSEIRVEIRFNCYLNPGSYFINCGVFGIVDTEEIVLHRILDACVFRILHDSEKTTLGVIDFGCSSDMVLSDTDR